MNINDTHITIWNWFKTATELPDEAISGIMGNLQAESNCEACRKQGDFSVNRASSKEYAEHVDSGLTPSSVYATDSIGWGLAQWTYYTRKAELLTFCRAHGKSIADQDAQLRFLVTEMQQDFGTMWKRLLNCTDISEASNMVLTEYERPAVLNKNERIGYSKEIFNALHGIPAQEEPDAWIQDEIAFLEEEASRLQQRIDYFKQRERL